MRGGSRGPAHASSPRSGRVLYVVEGFERGFDECMRSDVGSRPWAAARQSRGCGVVGWSAWRAPAPRCAAPDSLCVVLFGGGRAWAATGHGFLSSVGEAPVGTPLGEPTALAVDRADGRVFSADAATGVVNVFSSSGVFQVRLGEGSLFAAGVAVDEATGVVYVADTFQNAVLVFKPSGSGYVLFSEWNGEGLPGQEFGGVTGVAVDNSKGASAGDVYVVDREDQTLQTGAVDVFRPRPAGPEEMLEGERVGVLSAGRMEEPDGVAVSDGTGRVLVADGAKGAVYEFSASGAFEGKLTGAGSPQGSFAGSAEEEGNVSAVAVDDATGDLLVAEAERHLVSEFNPGGVWVGEITDTPSGPLGATSGVAVASSGDVYVADSEHARVDVFGPGVVVPDVAHREGEQTHAHGCGRERDARRGRQSGRTTSSSTARRRRWGRARHPSRSRAAKKRSRRPSKGYTPALAISSGSSAKTKTA